MKLEPQQNDQTLSAPVFYAAHKNRMRKMSIMKKLTTKINQGQ